MFCRQRCVEILIETISKTVEIVNLDILSTENLTVSSRVYAASVAKITFLICYTSLTLCVAEPVMRRKLST